MHVYWANCSATSRARGSSGSSAAVAWLCIWSWLLLVPLNRNHSLVCIRSTKLWKKAHKKKRDLIEAAMWQRSGYGEQKICFGSVLFIHHFYSSLLVWVTTPSLISWFHTAFRSSSVCTAQGWTQLIQEEHIYYIYCFGSAIRLSAALQPLRAPWQAGKGLQHSEFFLQFSPAPCPAFHKHGDRLCSGVTSLSL